MRITSGELCCTVILASSTAPACLNHSMAVEFACSSFQILQRHFAPRRRSNRVHQRGFNAHSYQQLFGLLQWSVRLGRAEVLVSVRGPDPAWDLLPSPEFQRKARPQEYGRILRLREPPSSVTFVSCELMKIRSLSSKALWVIRLNQS